MGDSTWLLVIYVIAFIAIFYFMAIRPQQKQRRAHQTLLSSLKKGDTIVTAAGIYGKVKRVEENLVVVEVAKGVSMKIARRAVVEIIRENADVKAVAPEGTSRGKGKQDAAELEEAADEMQNDVTDAAESAEGAEYGEVVDETEEDAGNR